MRIVINSRKPATAAASPPAAAGRHTAIAPANLQAVLDSAANAVHKGQAAWFTPTAWAEALALALPTYRPVMVDLTCGNGQLLGGAAAPGTFHRLGCDIEALPDPTSDLRPLTSFIEADVTLLADYLHRAEWEADCFVLNFPFDHHWYRDRLAFLSDSACRCVSMAFDKHDGRTSADTIDSTVAGLCLALDHCSPWGEGYIVANHNTVDRLIWNEDAPHNQLAAHIWCRLTVNHNICNPSPAGAGEGARRADEGRGGTPFQTDILYFARAHTSGCNKYLTANSLTEAAERLSQVGKQRMGLRAGSVVRQYEGGHTANTTELWDAIGLEWRTDQGKNKPTDQRWNIWLDVDGTLATNLTPFQEAAEPLKKSQYVRLHALKGKHPMQLILQKAERKDLEKAVFGNIWRVAPAVIEAVQGALAEYNAVRSPLYPLSQIQRLGYLDDNDDILCLHDLRWPQSLREPPFRAGQRYTIRTETIAVIRAGKKMNLTGTMDDVSWEGSELALFIRDAAGIERLFMEDHLRQPNVRLSIQKEGAPSPIEFNLQDLIAHFEIPEVPDVAAVHPEAYQHNVALLHLIEEIVNSANQN